MHTCPKCGLHCHCSGDIDDIDFGIKYNCIHCPDDEIIDYDLYNCYKAYYEGFDEYL